MRLACGRGDGWKKRFFVLTTRQEEAGEQMEIHHYLNYFKSEDQAADVAEGGVIDLGDVDEVRKADARGIEIVTESRVWQLRADSANTQEIWFNQLIRICSGDGQKPGPAPQLRLLANASCASQPSVSPLELDAAPASADRSSPITAMPRAASGTTAT